jgi:tetratricopeptide (TPR) repeat protein
MPVPTTAVVFGSDGGSPFAGRQRSPDGGHRGALAGEDANFIAISLEQGERAYPVIFHEYAHALLSATLSTVPMWANEGIAELYSTFSLTDGGRSALIGAPPVHHVSNVRQQSLGSIIDLLSAGPDSPAYTDATRRQAFYARSWLLAHYFFLGSQTRRAQLPRYLDLTERYVPIPEAFRVAFECEPKVIEAELREYLNRFALNAVKVTFEDRIGLTTTLRSEQISEPEARAYTAELLARQERLDEAQMQIAAALAASPDLPRALAAMGRLHIRSGRTDEALPLLERAAALEPDDAAIAGTFARAVVDQLRLQGTAADGDLEGIARARAALTRAAQPDPEDAYVTAMRLVEYADGSSLENASRLLEQAVAQAPAREEYQLLLAQVLIEQSEQRDLATRDSQRDVSRQRAVAGLAAPDPLGEARAMLDRLVVRGSRPEVRGAARRMLARRTPSSPDGSPDRCTRRGDAGRGCPETVQRCRQLTRGLAVDGIAW